MYDRTVCSHFKWTYAGRKPQRLLLALSLVVSVIVGCAGQDKQRVPTHLIGGWGTEDPRYKALLLEISQNTVVFTTAEGGVETYWISKVESAGKGNTVMYILHGEQSGMRLKFQFYYEARNGGRLRFRNQIGIPWHRVENLSD